ncbi:MAG: hypothetical protein Q8R24_06480 [Legionellaceae bacterium]|nr:hypothetical protein [Legionellaceae bacterium]
MVFRFNSALVLGTLNTLNKKHVWSSASKNEGKPYQYPKLEPFKGAIRSIIAHETNKSALSNNTPEKYFAEVYVTDTNQENGTGHVSASMIKTTEKGTEVVKHMSYMPYPGLSSVGAMACGFLPVCATNFEHSRDEDIQKSNTIIRVPLTHDQFKQGVKAHGTIEKGSQDYSYLYAVTAEANIVALMLAKMVSITRASEASIKHYTEDTGLYPIEDNSGILMVSTCYHPEDQTQSVVLNCTAAVQLVLEESGLEIDDKYILPASLGRAVLNQCPGAKTVSESLVQAASQNKDIDDDSDCSDGMRSYN